MGIGIAMMTQPRVLFMEEPTTRLDSYASQEVMMAAAQVDSWCKHVHDRHQHAIQPQDFTVSSCHSSNEKLLAELACTAVDGTCWQRR